MGTSTPDRLRDQDSKGTLASRARGGPQDSRVEAVHDMVGRDTEGVEDVSGRDANRVADTEDVIV